MNEHEIMEIQVSALIDGELSRSAMLSLVDRLLDEEESRSFYRKARQLDLTLESARASGGGGIGASGELWQRIEEAARRTAPVPAETSAAKAPPRRASRWLLRAAAAALVLVGVWSVGSSMLSPSSERHTIVEIIAGSAPDSMDDERFITLTTELLQADPRYHHAMLEIVGAVNRRTMPREGVVDWNRGFLVNASADGERFVGMSEAELAQNPPQIY